jgi:paraquat-inducible protein B
MIFVNAPYDQYVNPGTRFWNASGLDVSVGAGGVEVRTQSLVALLAGGIAFDTPPFAFKTEPAAANTVFTFYNDRATAMKRPDTITRHYVLYFKESLRGLSVGAPVTLLGLQGGEVISVGLDIDPATLTLRGRVEIVAFPERLVARLYAQQTAAGETLAQSEKQSRALLKEMVEQRGLRAQLRSGSLLTGQLYVALDFFPDAPKATINLSQDPPELPVVPSTLPDVETKLSSIVAKLDKLPYEAIGTDLTKLLATLDQTLKSVDKAVNRIDADVTPELKTTVAELRSAITAATEVLNSTDMTIVGQNAPGQQELRVALQEVARAARSVRILANFLEENPSALIRGK